MCSLPVISTAEGSFLRKGALPHAALRGSVHEVPQVFGFEEAPDALCGTNRNHEGWPRNKHS